MSKGFVGWVGPELWLLLNGTFYGMAPSALLQRQPQLSGGLSEHGSFPGSSSGSRGEAGAQDCMPPVHKEAFNGARLICLAVHMNIMHGTCILNLSL